MPDLTPLLAQAAAQVTEAVVWSPSRFRLTTCLHDQLPPLELVTSARALVTRVGEILVVRERSGHHILPGGRRRAGEMLWDTARREVLEETGWQIEAPQLLGWRHFHHLTSRPTGYAYPYPDFVQVIYAASGVSHAPDRRTDDGPEIAAHFASYSFVRQLPLTPGEQLLLEAVIGGGPGSPRILT